MRSINFKRHVALRSRELCSTRADSRWSKMRLSRFFNFRHSTEAITPNVIKYWTAKLLNPQLHPGRHGGRREGTYKLTEAESLHVQAAFMAGLKRKPDRNLIRAAASLSILVNTHLRPLTNALRVAAGQTPLPAAVELNRRDLYGYLKSWGWSKKVPIRIHIHKFRPDNIVRYINYATAVTWIPPERLKFLDESTFASRSTLPLLPPPLALFLS